MARSSAATSSPNARPGRLWRTVGAVVTIALIYWIQEKYLGGSEGFEQDPVPPIVESEGEHRGDREPPVVEKNPGKASASEEGKKGGEAAEKPAFAGKVHGYDRLEGCRMIDHRNNDGDSFWVRHGDREFELRLYYVDTAEKYLSDRYEDQRRRVAEQARDFGGLSVEQTVELGKAAKLYTARLLEGKSFTVFTKWERVYDGERFYGWVELPGTDGEYLSERLIEKGIGRIHTKGEPSPDGASYRQYKAHLEKLEREAKEADRGAWGLN